MCNFEHQNKTGNNCKETFVVREDCNIYQAPGLPKYRHETGLVFVNCTGLGMCDNYTVTNEAWFEVEVKDLKDDGQDYRGRFTIALLGEVAPKAVENFVSLTKGCRPKEDFLEYRNSTIHRIVPDFVVHMGDITAGDGTGGKSIFGDYSDQHDDSGEFILSHRSPGWVAMANRGKDTNGSQFYIILRKARWLDGIHEVFGKVIRGYDVIKTVGAVPSDPENDKPKKNVRIVDCGLNNLDQKYDLLQDQLDSLDDI